MFLTGELFDPDLEPITSFDGDFRFLSNFHEEPGHTYQIGPLIFRTLEAAYQSEKTEIMEEKIEFQTYSHLPGKCKRMGKKVTERKNWKMIRVPVMTNLTDRKYENHVLAEMLLSTGRRQLIEGNIWDDTFWGQCPVGNGENNLGIILMEKRLHLAHGFLRN